MNTQPLCGGYIFIRIDLNLALNVRATWILHLELAKQPNPCQIRANHPQLRHSDISSAGFFRMEQFKRNAFVKFQLNTLSLARNLQNHCTIFFDFMNNLWRKKNCNANALVFENLTFSLFFFQFQNFRSTHFPSFPAAQLRQQITRKLMNAAQRSNQFSWVEWISHSYSN